MSSKMNTTSRSVKRKQKLRRRAGRRVLGRSSAVGQITCREMSDEEVLLLWEEGFLGFPLGAVEQSVFSKMREMCTDYTGGVWNTYALPGGAWYMAPIGDHVYSMKDWAGRRVAVSAQGAGLAVMIILVNHLSWKFHHEEDMQARDLAVRHHDALTAYAFQLKDGPAIREILD